MTESPSARRTRRALEESGKPGSAELCDLLRQLLDGGDPAEGSTVSGG